MRSHHEVFVGTLISQKTLMKNVTSLDQQEVMFLVHREKNPCHRIPCTIRRMRTPVKLPNKFHHLQDTCVEQTKTPKCDGSDETGLNLITKGWRPPVMINVESLALSDDSTTPVQGGPCPNFFQRRTSPQWLEYRDLGLRHDQSHDTISSVCRPSHHI